MAQEAQHLEAGPTTWAPFICQHNPDSFLAIGELAARPDAEARAFFCVGVHNPLNHAFF